MKTLWKWVSRLIIALAVLLLAMRSVDWMIRRSAALPAPPQPNGYDRLVEVARKVSKPIGEISELTDAQIKDLAQTNKVSLDLVRQSLALESRVTNPRGRDWMAQHEADTKRLKVLAVLLALESKSLMLEGRTNEAAQCQLDIIRLGHAIGRGGARPDVLQGLVVEMIGVASVQTFLPQTTLEWCRQAARQIESLESNRDSATQVVANDRAWTGQRFGLVGKVGDIFFRGLNRNRRSELAKRYAEISRKSRRLTLRLAARAYELEEGTTPANTAALVPDYLGAVPVDPETGAKFDQLPPTQGASGGSANP